MDWNLKLYCCGSLTAAYKFGGFKECSNDHRILGCELRSRLWLLKPSYSIRCRNWTSRVNFLKKWEFQIL